MSAPLKMLIDQYNYKCEQMGGTLLWAWIFQNRKTQQFIEIDYLKLKKISVAKLFWFLTFSSSLLSQVIFQTNVTTLKRVETLSPVQIVQCWWYSASPHHQDWLSYCTGLAREGERKEGIREKRGRKKKKEIFFFSQMLHFYFVKIHIKNSNIVDMTAMHFRRPVKTNAQCVAQKLNDLIKFSSSIFLG